MMVQSSKTIYNLKALIHNLQDAHQPAFPSPPPPKSTVHFKLLTPFSSILYFTAFELQREGRKPYRFTTQLNIMQPRY